MADSTVIFTFQDNAENPSLCPSQLMLNEDQTSLNFDDHQSGQDLDFLLDTDNLLSDPSIWQVCDNAGADVLTGNSGAPDSGFIEHRDFNSPKNPVFVDHSMALLPFSVPRAQYNCACCQILREITHTNGMYVKRLEIHGVFGIITHAVLGIFDHGSSFQTQDPQMFDFHKESTVTVKKFLVQYYEVCRQEGYSPMLDPLATFYEALSVGFNEPDNKNDFLQFTPEITGNHQYEQFERLNQGGGGSDQVGSSKIPLAMQRERTRNLGLKDFAEYFDLPIEDAARKLNICPTVMKKICRKHGVLRWPYRKIKSIEKKISKSEKILEASADEKRARAMQDIQKYKQQLNNIFAELYSQCSY